MKFVYQTPADLADLQQFGRVLSQCFVSPIVDDSVYLNRIGIENTRILRDRSLIVGGCGIIHLGQWYNGSNIKMAGIAAVGIAPEYRGQGAAITLLRSLLKELHDQETPISVLFSAAQPLYRKAGYEQAGALCSWEVPTYSIQVQSPGLTVRSLALDSDQFSTLYNQQAPLYGGHLDRNAVIWANQLEFKPEMPTYAYEFGNEGYVVFQQKGDLLTVKDWVLLTPAAIQQFWAFLGKHLSQIETIEWKSAPVDALSLWLPDQTAKLKWLKCWMLRIVHLQKALEHRNYPNGLETELHLEIHDPILSRNHGKFILAVANGKGTVTPGGRGDLQLEMNTLSPLYTGLFSVQQLARSYKLTGTLEAIQTADRLFAASTPWMPDSF